MNKAKKINLAETPRRSQVTEMFSNQPQSWPLSGFPLSSPGSVLSVSGSPGPAAVPPPGPSFPLRPGQTELRPHAIEALVETESEVCAQPTLLPSASLATHR